MKTIAVSIFILIFAFQTESFSQASYTSSGKKIYFNAGIAAPIFDFQELYGTGPSIEAGMVVFSPPVTPFDVTVSVGYNSFKFLPESFTNTVQTQLGATVSNFSPDWKVTDIPVMAGLKLRFNQGNITPYASVEFGVHFVNFNQRFNGNQVNVTSTNPATVSLDGVTESASETAFGASLGLGLEVSVSPLINLNLGAKYNYSGVTFQKLYKVFIASDRQFTSKGLDRFEYVTARVGLIFFL